MDTSQAAHLSPEIVLQAMKKNGVTHVVWLPDSETNWLYTLMLAEPSLSLVAVAREGLAFSTAAGLHAGGKTPIILIQNTGLMEAGDSMRGWALGLDLPVVMMVGYRGWSGTANPRTPRRRTPSPFSRHSASIITWSRATPMRRKFQRHSTRRARTGGRSRYWSATNTTASSDRKRMSKLMQSFFACQINNY